MTRVRFCPPWAGWGATPLKIFLHVVGGDRGKIQEDECVLN